MAKREFIERITVPTDNGGYFEEKVVTEQDILKPYFENAKAQIRHRLDGVNIALDVLVKNDPLISKLEGAKTTLLECIDILDNLLSEPGDIE